MFTKDIGIDLGTANTLVYMKGRGIIMREPSVVAVDPRSDELRVRSVGHEAKAVIGRAPGSIVAVRPLKDGVIADFDIPAAMLQSFIRQACGNSILAHPRVVICVPSGVTEVERRAVRQAAAKAGLMDPDLAKEYCGAGLKRVCELAGIPPVLHMGSCVDISRMLILAAELSKDSGIPISKLPVVGCAPEWMSEKAVSIGNYVVATGIDTYLGVDPYTKGSSEVTELLQGEHGIKDWVEANYTVETDIEKLGDRMIERIEAKRAALGI